MRSLAAFITVGAVFQSHPQPMQSLHRMYTACQPFPLARSVPQGAKSNKKNFAR